MSGLRYAAIVSKIGADLCLSIALSRCHYLCGFALTLSLLSLFPQPPSSVRHTLKI